MSRVSINEVLADLASGKQCSLEYVRGQGKSHGRIKKIHNAIEGWNYAAFKQRRPINHIRAKNTKVISKQKTKGLIPIIDLTNNTQLTLFISHIVKYNGLQIIH